MRMRQRSKALAMGLALLAVIAQATAAGAAHTTDLGMSAVAEVGSGWLHSCARHTDGAVSCWGSNLHGALGDGTTGHVRSIARRVPGLPSDVVQLSVGNAHTCVMTAGGDVWCWGSNLNEQISAGLAPVVPSPAKLTITTGAGVPVRFTWLGAGNVHTCALSTTGVPWCWGENGASQLGRTTFLPQGGPAPVNTPAGGWPEPATKMDVGGDHSCALSGGSLYCWGYNTNGQIGNGTTQHAARPTRVTPANGYPGGGITGISLAVFHSCATTHSRQVFCWGSNDYGRLGVDAESGAATSATVPTLVQGNAAVQDNGAGTAFRADRVSAGLEHTCAWNAGGQAWCWGRNVFGQLGDQLPSTQRNQPLFKVWQSSLPLLEPVGTFAGLSAGYNHTCAATSTGTAFCWGMGSAGQLGDGNYAPQARPSTVLAPLP
jgi:alpha-tubulin suppressor-like RCC1 family protein